VSWALISNLLFVAGALCFLVGTVINLAVLWASGS